MSDMGFATKDALGEVGNICMGSAATALSTLLSRRVTITTPQVSVTTPEQVVKSITKPIVLISVSYLDGIDGENLLVLKEDDAARIVGVMMGMPDDPPQTLGSLEMSALGEAMNQMMGMASCALSDLVKRTIEIAPPSMAVVNETEGEDAFMSLLGQSPIAEIKFNLNVDGLLDSTLVQMIPLPVAQQLVLDLTGGELELEPEQPAVEEGEPEFRLDDNLVPLGGLPVSVRVVMGRASLPLGRMMSLSGGDIVTLERAAGDPVELYAGDHRLGWGEIVTVDGEYGVRIVEICGSAEFKSSRGGTTN